MSKKTKAAKIAPNTKQSTRLQISSLSDMVEIGPKFSEAVGVDHLLSLILKQTIDLMGTEVCIIWLKDKKNRFVPRISFGLKTKYIQSLRINASSRIVKCIMSKSCPTYVRDLHKNPRMPFKKLVNKEGLKSVLAAPLVVENEKIGALTICSRSVREFSDVETKIFDALAKQAALAIANVGLYDKVDKKVKEKIREISALFSMSRSFSSSVDLELLLKVILEKMRFLTKAKFCTLKLFGRSRKSIRFISSAGIGRGDQNKSSEFKDEIFDKIMKNKTMCVINDILTYFRNNIPAYLKKHKIRSMLMVPLYRNKRRIGVLSVYIPEVRIFPKEDIEMFEMVASLCSMAIDNAEMLERIRKDYLNTIKTLAKVIDANDAYTKGHCDKVMKYSLMICRKLKLSPKDENAIKTASLLHDIGKIGIDLSIIRKAEKLTEDDWTKIKLHPEIGAKIVSQMGFLHEIVPIIKHHHERYNGGGYPESGRCAGRIPLGARIIAVADAYDAMTSDRPYRKAMPQEAAMEELRRCAGAQFDPVVVKAFIVR